LAPDASAVLVVGDTTRFALAVAGVGVPHPLLCTPTVKVYVPGVTEAVVATVRLPVLFWSVKVAGAKVGVAPAGSPDVFKVMLQAPLPPMPRVTL
jgi:hypothetical protein